MEVVENKDKYIRKETRAKMIQRYARKFIWVVPVLVIAGGLTFAYIMFQNLNAQGSPLRRVQYDAIIAKDKKKAKKKPEKEVTKLDNYKEKIKEEKKKEIMGPASRYDKIISGRDLIKGVKFGDVIYEAPAGGESEKEGEVVPDQDSIPQPEQEPAPLPEPAPSRSSSARAAQERRVRQQAAISRRAERPNQEGKKVKSDTIQKQQVANKEPEVVDHFNTFKSNASPNPAYIKAFVYGNQEVISGSFVRLRLGETIIINGKEVPKNTVFTGVAKINKNKIVIEVRRIDRYDVNYLVYDKDYSRGIVISASKAKEVEDALNESFYDNGQSGSSDIPLEVIRDVTQSIVQKKKRKQAVIELHDGYQVYINEEEKI